MIDLVHIVIVDDHPLFRAGLMHALSRDPRFSVIAEAGDATQAIAIAKRVPIGVAIVDVLMPSMSGISLAREILEVQPSCPILGLSVIDEPRLIANMLLAGAVGFALKTQPTDEIIEAVATVAQRTRYLPPRISHDAVERELTSTNTQPLETLTRREREVFELVIRGNTNDVIATLLAISRRTVETHRQRVANKLSAHSIVDMLRVAAVHGGLS